VTRVSEEAAFLFDPDAIRSTNEPAEDTVRLIWMFVSLARAQTVTYERYAALFSRTTRTFKRDLAKLREIGLRFGFSLSKLQRGEIRLLRFDGDPQPRQRRSQAEDLGDALLAINEALGEVVATSFRGWADASVFSSDRFLRIATPRLRESSDIGATYELLRAAWRNRARVRFRYPAADRPGSPERIVEPYRTTYNAGRYYLIGFDVRPSSGGWRQYALDRIIGPIARAGSFLPRTVPSEYHGEDAIGLFKTGTERQVTVAFSDAIAQSVAAREWQRSQSIGRDEAGRLTLTLRVFDLGEAVRWALSFGTEAEVVAPTDAVALAREMVATLQRRYVDEPTATAMV